MWTSIFRDLWSAAAEVSSPSRRLLRNLLRNQRRWRASSTTAWRRPRQRTATLRRTSPRLDALAGVAARPPGYDEVSTSSTAAHCDGLAPSAGVTSSSGRSSMRTWGGGFDIPLEHGHRARLHDPDNRDEGEQSSQPPGADGFIAADHQTRSPSGQLAQPETPQALGVGA